jgi:signal transduction histidine kinase
VFRGLVRNAIENTPDGGTIQIRLYQQDTILCLAVKDFGVGMDEQFQQQLFHGFIHRGDTNDYSSGNPYDFGAGGQGLDLLRTKLYSERLGFYIRVESHRCPCIRPENPCPGRTQSGRWCSNETNCQKLGGSAFILEFPLSMLVAASHDSTMKE